MNHEQMLAELVAAGVLTEEIGGDILVRAVKDAQGRYEHHTTTTPRRYVTAWRTDAPKADQ